MAGESNLDGAYTALQAWKSAITDDPKKNLGTWVGPNVCSYKGVFCDFTEDEMGASASAFPVVASIDLNHANLQGTLIKELSLLTDMSLFHLNSNSYFSGTIPQELFYKNLDALFLNNNQFEDEIPQNLENSPASVINLANNKLSGNIPASFGFMGYRKTTPDA
nr:leucine-rich repeat extensin-like protein 4 [Arachis hypogaea]